MMTRRVFPAFFVVGVMACGDDGAGPDPIACTDDTGSVDVTVTTGASVRFDWEPACAVTLLLVERQGGDMWLIGTDLPGTLGLGDPDLVNLITPPVTYGAAPSVVDEQHAPEALVAGVAYDLILWRALRENSTAVCQSQFENGCLLAVHEFVR